MEAARKSHSASETTENTSRVNLPGALISVKGLQQINKRSIRKEKNETKQKHPQSGGAYLWCSPCRSPSPPLFRQWWPAAWRAAQTSCKPPGPLALSEGHLKGQCQVHVPVPTTAELREAAACWDVESSRYALNQIRLRETKTDVTCWWDSHT